MDLAGDGKMSADPVHNNQRGQNHATKYDIATGVTSPPWKQQWKLQWIFSSFLLKASFSLI